MFTKEFEIHYYEIDAQRQATPVSLLNYMEETAICHSEAAGCGLDVLYAIGTAWILNRWSIDILRYPRWNDRIIVETQPTYVDRFYAWREFNIRDTGGEYLVKASSLWIYLNLEKKRPVRVPEDYRDRYGVTGVKEHQCSFDSLSGSEDEGRVRPFYIRRGDIDTNNHVNNTKYLEWILEAVPEEVYTGQRLSSLQIEYRKELTQGMLIASKSTSKTNIDTGHTTVDHSILSEDGQVTHAVARTLWTPR